MHQLYVTPGFLLLRNSPNWQMYFLFHCASGRVPGKQTLTPWDLHASGLRGAALSSKTSRGTETGWGRGRGWAVTHSQQGPPLSPKGARLLRGPFGVISKWGEWAGPWHPCMDWSVDVGCLWGDGSFGPSNSLQQGASPGQTQLWWQPQPRRGTWSSVCTHLWGERSEERLHVCISTLQREKQSSFWYSPDSQPPMGASWVSTPSSGCMKLYLEGGLSKLLRGKCFDQK